MARRLLPIASIASSAVTNASVTWRAIGKRAQAMAKWRDRPISGMPDVMRAFSGVDERRIARVVDRSREDLVLAS